MRPALLVPLVLLATRVENGALQAEQTDTAVLLAALALAPEEREELLALALTRVQSGDCEGALACLDAAARESDELGRRLVRERARIAAWIELRDAFLADLAQSGKPLALHLPSTLAGELSGKKLSSPIQREGDELVLARGSVRRVNVRALPPEALVTAIPAQRFEGASEWLKIYPYCVAGNARWKRIETREECSAELARDAAELYPRLLALAPQAQAVDALAHAAVPADATAARALLERIAGLLALGREAPLVATRLASLAELAARLLALVSESLEVADLVAAEVVALPGGSLRLAYAFEDEKEARDWRRDDRYLADVHQALAPVQGGEDEATRFAPRRGGFEGRGATCWRHVLEFATPVRVRYRVRWAPIQGHPGQVFSFALGILADQRERHVRAHELGFLYVDERDHLYTAVRPKGDSTVQLGQTYAMELVHGVHEKGRAEVWSEGVLRAQADATPCREGGVFLWIHSDLLVSVPSLEIEGRVTPAALARARASWAAEELGARGLALSQPSKAR